jgi:hypothetical protein
MTKFLLLTVLASLLILGGCASVQAQSPQMPSAAVQTQSQPTPSAAGNAYIIPAEIKILGEAATPVTDANELKALADEAKKNVCVKEIKPRGSNMTLYLIFCGTAQEPYCPPPIPGQPRRCY